MLHGEASADSALNGHRPRAGARASAHDVVQSVDYIRKELRRLAKMARQMQHGELAHFIDVATEVASEAVAAESKSARRP